MQKPQGSQKSSRHRGEERGEMEGQRKSSEVTDGRTSRGKEK